MQLQSQGSGSGVAGWFWLRVFHEAAVIWSLTRAGGSTSKMTLHMVLAGGFSPSSPLPHKLLRWPHDTTAFTTVSDQESKLEDGYLLWPVLKNVIVIYAILHRCTGQLYSVRGDEYLRVFCLFFDYLCIIELIFLISKIVKYTNPLPCAIHVQESLGAPQRLASTLCNKV